jgi:dTDP-glucose 4,6-dehydratase
MSFPPLPVEDLEHVLANTRELWQNFRGQRIFITGATGFFGVWLLETFIRANDVLNLGAELVGLSRDPEKFFDKVPHIANCSAIKLWKGDVRDFEFPQGSFSHVIHAGTTSSAPVPPLEMLDTIVQGTRRVLDFAVSCGASKLLFVSSGAVYGKQPPEITHVPESYMGAPDTLNPDSAYGEGKRVAELLCSIYSKNHGIEVKIARCFAFVGPHLPLDAHFAIGNFIRDAIGGRVIRVNGDGTPMRSYLYAADLAVWLWSLLLGNKTGAFNVGSSEGYSIRNIAHMVSKAFSSAPEVVISQPSIDEHTISRYIPETEAASKALALSSAVEITAAIQKTIAFYNR